MQTKSKKPIIFMVSFIILFGCSKVPNQGISEAEKQFSMAIPVSDMNKSIRIKVIYEKEYYSSGSDINLMLENKTSYFISFDTNPPVQLLRNMDTQWIEVENAITYLDTMLLYPQSEPGLNLQTTTVKPILDQNSAGAVNTLIPLRILVVGEIMNGDTPTGKQVGAYLDVFIKPTPDLIKTTEPIIYSTKTGANNQKGKIEGIVTSASEVAEPLSDVIIDLTFHPLFSESNQKKIIATTKTDLQGRFSFDNVEPDVYALQTTLFLVAGGSCGDFDLTKIIRIETGTIATVNLTMKCAP